jgi:hypothetical protein
VQRSAALTLGSYRYPRFHPGIVASTHRSRFTRSDSLVSGQAQRSSHPWTHLRPSGQTAPVPSTTTSRTVSQMQPGNKSRKPLGWQIASLSGIFRKVLILIVSPTAHRSKFSVNLGHIPAVGRASLSGGQKQRSELRAHSLLNVLANNEIPHSRHRKSFG